VLQEGSLTTGGVIGCGTFFFGAFGITGGTFLLVLGTAFGAPDFLPWVCAASSGCLIIAGVILVKFGRESSPPLRTVSCSLLITLVLLLLAGIAGIIIVLATCYG
jgi:hypothetical protein